MKKIVAGSLLGTIIVTLISFIAPQYVAHATGGIDCNQVSEVNPLECSALVDIYDNNTSADWSNYAGWFEALVLNTPDDTICDWQGVTCTNGAVTEISLTNLALDIIPDSLANITSLSSLQISHTNITQVPLTISNFSLLTSLDLSNNKITNLPNIEGLTNLEVALFNNNYLTKIVRLGPLTMLHTLTFDNNHIVSVEEGSLDQFYNISTFSIDNNYISREALDINTSTFFDTYAPNRENTQTLDNDNILSNIQVSYDSGYNTIIISVDYNLGSGGSVPGATISLRAAFETIEHDVDAYPEWKKNVESNIFTYNIGEGDFAPQTGTIVFTGTRGVKINTGYIYPFSMSITTGYHDIDRNNNRVYSAYQWDANASEFQRCNLIMGMARQMCVSLINLVEENPSSTLTTLTGWSGLLEPNHIINSLCDWEDIRCNHKGYPMMINLSGRNISILSTGSIIGLEGLQELYLGHNSITTLPDSIEGLYSLEILDLSYNQLSGLTTDFTNMQNLISLFINNNQFSEIPSELYVLGSFNVLNELDISHNNVSSISSNIYDMSALTSLNISHNQINSLPVEIGSLRNLTTLSFSNNLISTLEPGIFAQIGNNLISIDVDYNYLDRNTLALTETDILDILQPNWELTQYGSDLTAPSISDVHIESSNLNDPSIALSGDTITLSFLSDEQLDINNLFVTIGGESVLGAQDDCGEGVFCYSASIFANQLPEQGLVTFTIDYQDAFGNAGPLVTSTNDSSIVDVDTIIPVISNIHIQSDNINNNQLATIGNTITLSFEADEEVTAEVFINGNLIDESPIGCGTYCYEAIWGLIDTGETNGSVELEIIAYDNYGNTGEIITQTSDGSDVLIDTIAPVLSNIHIESNRNPNYYAALGDTLTISFQSDEELDLLNLGLGEGVTINGLQANLSQIGCEGFCYEAIIIVDENQPEDYASPNILVKDLAGNVIEATSTTDGSNVFIDPTAPYDGYVSISSSNVNNTQVAKPGNTITVIFDTNEAININTISGDIAGISIDHASTGTYCSSMAFCYEVSAVVQNDTAFGTATFHIYYTNVVGSSPALSPIEATNDGSFVIVDPTKPTLSHVSLSSSNVTGFAREGDTITITVFSTEELISIYPILGGFTGDSLYFIGQGSCGSDLDKYCYQGTLYVDNNFSEGAQSLRLEYTDLAGNDGDQFSGTTDDSSVTIDYTTPTISNIHIESNNIYYTGLAKSGDIITVSFKSDQPLDTELSVANLYSVNTNNLTTPLSQFACSGGFCYRFSATVDNTYINETVLFDMTLSDNVGNQTDIINTTTDGSIVKVDNQKPIIVSLSMYSDNIYGSNIAISGNIVSITLQTTEQLRTGSISIMIAGLTGTINIFTGATAVNCLPYYCYGGDIITNTYTEQGPASIFIQYSDLAGNSDTITSLTTGDSPVYIDTIAPQLSQIHIESNNMISNQKIGSGNIAILSFTSDEEIPLENIYADINGLSLSNWIQIPCETYCYSGSIEASDYRTDGMISLFLAYSDVFGNSGETSTTSDGSYLMVDNTFPTINTTQAYSNNPNTSFARSGDKITVVFETDEDILTGLSSIVIDGKTAGIQKMDCGEFCYSGSITVDNSNSNDYVYYTIHAYDTFGNYISEPTTNTDILIDTIFPTLSQLMISSDNTDPTYAISGDTLEVSFESNDILSSGSISVLISGKTGTLQTIDCDGYCYTLSVPVDGTMSLGTPVFSINVRDLAGNPNTNSTGVYMNLYIDARLPIITDTSIYSNNINPNYAASGDSITLSIMTNKAFITNNISATIAGQEVTMTDAGCGGTCFEGTLIVNHTTTNGLADIFVSYQDERGNSASSTGTNDSTTVTIDTIAPSILTASIRSTNENSSIALEGDNVVVEFETDEIIDLTTAQVTIGGQTASLEEISCSGICYIATVTIDSNFNDGELDIAISYSDLMGNVGITYTSVTDGSSVQVMKEAPTLSYVHIASDNPYNTLLARSGDNIILSLRASEQLPTSSIKIDILGQSAVVATGSCGTYCYTATIKANNNSLNPVSFTIDYANAIGVSGQQITAVTDDSSVTIDNQNPSIISASIRSSNTQTGLAISGNVIMVSFTTDEILLTGSISLTIANKSGSVVRMLSCDGFCYSGSIIVDSTTTPGNVDVSIVYRDAAGNSGTASAITDGSTATIDNSVPVLSSIFLFSNNAIATGAKSGDTIILLFTANEALMTGSLSGLIAGRPANLQRMNCDGFCYSGSIIVDTGTNNGIAGIRISYADIAGNVGDVKTAVTSGTVNIDTQKPVLDTIHIATDNTNTSVGENGDTLTLTFRSNEQLNISALSVTLGGQTAAVSQTACAGYCYTAELEIDNNLSAGNVSMSISYQDIIGNIGDLRTATTDSSSVTISTCAGVLDISENECKTIVNFATALSGTTVANMSGWSQAWGTNAINNICDWQGISCAGGHIVGIDLSANNLSSLPSSIASLPYLTALDISTNNFSSFPTAILSITNLELFSIAHNELITIPAGSLSSLNSLNVLDVSYNHLARAVLTSSEVDIMDTYQANWEDTQTILSDSRLNSLILAPSSGAQMTGSTLTLGIRYSQGAESASFTGSLTIDIGTGMVSANSNNGWISLGNGIYTYIILPSNSAQNDATILFTGAFVIDTITGVIYDFAFTLWSGYDSDYSNNIITGTYFWIDTVLPERANVATGKDGASSTFNLNTRPVLTAESQSKPIETGNEPLPGRGNMITPLSAASVYRWAYENSVTTMPLNRARLYVPVQRYEAATMIVNYIRNVEQKKIEPRDECNIYEYKDINQNVNESVRNVIQDICNLGLMGRGTTANSLTTNFRPYDILTTNELEIILRRYDATSLLNITRNRRIDVMDLLMRTLK